MSKNLKNKYDQKFFDSAKKSTTDAIKTASKGAIQKTAEASGDLTGSKIADELMSVSKKPDANIQTEAGAASSKDASRASPKDVPKKIHISRIKATNCWWIKVGITMQQWNIKK